MPTRRTAQRIHDVLKNIASIETYTNALAQDTFRETPMAIDAVERCLERIAEAARKIGDQFDTTMPDGVDLRAIRQFGSVLRHDYDAVDSTIIWNVIAQDLPKLKAAFQALQEQHPLPKIKTDPDFDPF